MDTSDVAQVLLQPPPIHVTGHSTRLQSSFVPFGNEIALFNSADTTASSDSKHKQLLYRVQYTRPSLETRSLYLDAYTIYASLQTIAAEQAAQSTSSGLSLPISSEYVTYLNRICGLYKGAIVAQLPKLQGNAALTHHATLHGIISLVEILYAPFDGRGEGVVGEEVLDWVNTVDRAPSAEEGEELADLARPWEHPNYWPYIYRCILRAHILSATALLSLLAASHPSSGLRSLASLAVSLLKSFPRTTAFSTESSFLSSLRSWRSKAQGALSSTEDMFASLESEGDLEEDERYDWEAAFKCLFELIAGDENRVLEASEDWREALGAWGVWVNAGGRREGLPDALYLIQKTHPVDKTLPSEAVQAALFAGDVTRSLQQANLISPWLVAHLSDLFTHLQILEPPPTPTNDSSDDYQESRDAPPSLRTHFFLAFAEYLASDSSLWRLTVDYLASCESQGRARMTQVLRNIPLLAISITAQPDAEDEQARDANVDEGVPGDADKRHHARSSEVQDILRVCANQGLEDEMESICKTYSEVLVAEKRYGEAIALCIRAGDQKRIARIADRVLAEYIQNGQEAFVRHVDSIPTSLLRPSGPSLRAELFSEERGDDDQDLESEVPAVPLGAHSSRLNFLARYRDFFALYARGERRQAAALLVLLLTSNTAPKSFSAIMLLDVIPLLEDPEILLHQEETYELMRVTEDITAPISATGRDIYGHLDSLSVLLGAQEGDSTESRMRRAMKELDVVRGALARHVARCYCL